MFSSTNRLGDPGMRSSFVKNDSTSLGHRRRVGQGELHHDLGSKIHINRNDELVEGSARSFDADLVLASFIMSFERPAFEAALSTSSC
jgi:hypothetical protein